MRFPFLLLLMAAAGLAQVRGQIASPVYQSLLAIPPAVSGGGGGATYSFVAGAIAYAASADPATTAAIDTSGAELIVISATVYNTAGSPTDSKGNTWTALTSRGNASGNYSNQLFYCINPTVGSGHTFTLQANYPIIAVQSFSLSSGTPVFVAENGNGSASFTTLQPGSVSNDGDNNLFVTGITWSDTGATASIDGSFTIANQDGVNLKAAFARKIQTTGGAENPTWTITTSGNVGSTSIAVFK